MIYNPEFMTDHGLISVVVPVYNASEFLSDALESLRSQSYSNFEAILVNDGSTDDSEEICRKYCNTDSRFRLITHKNKGVSEARNVGIDNSRGEWISFLDADDCLFSDTLEVLVTLAQKNDVKIISGDYVQGRDVVGTLIKLKESDGERGDSQGEKVNNKEAILRGLYQKTMLNSICGKLFHLSVFKDYPPLRFHSGRYEDLDLFYQAFDRVPEILILDRPVYFYRDNPKSFINTWSDSRLDVLDVTDRIVDYMKDRSPELYMAALDRRFSACFNMLLEMEKHHVDNPEQKARCLKVIKEQRWSELKDPEVRLKNKLGALISYLGFPVIRLLCRF